MIEAMDVERLALRREDGARRLDLFFGVRFKWTGNQSVNSAEFSACAGWFSMLTLG